MSSVSDLSSLTFKVIQKLSYKKLNPALGNTIISGMKLGLGKMVWDSYKEQQQWSQKKNYPSSKGFALGSRIVMCSFQMLMIIYLFGIFKKE